MNVLHVKYVLVGGGVAASQAAEAIRSADSQGDLLLIGQEINRPYHRTPLSKEFFVGRRQRVDLFTHPSEWYADQHVQLRTGRRAARLDATRHSVTLDNGEEISFDRLLIATGGSPAALNVPGAQMPNLYYLRTLEEAERLQHAVEQAKAAGGTRRQAKAGRVAVIGGGWLGVELAGSMVETGVHVDLILSQGTPWHRFAGEVTGRCVKSFLESKGMAVHGGSRATRLEGDGRVQRVVLADEKTIECDFAVAAVGNAVNRELLRGTPIDAEKAILVDEGCRTSVADIYAAGDCAAVFDPLFGKHRVMPHETTAAITGTIAGKNMAGGEAKLDQVSRFETRVLGMRVTVWGEARAVDRRIIRGNCTAESPAFVEIGVGTDGRVAQVIAVNQEETGLEAMVRGRVKVDGVEEPLKDPGVPLQNLWGT